MRNGTLASIAHDAVNGGQSVQQKVRELLNLYPADDALEIITTNVSEFRTQAKTYEDTLDFSTDYRKRVNNVCNDISRICREVTGKSIVCVSRKNGEYVYEAKEPTPRAKPNPSAAPAPHTVYVHHEPSQDDKMAYALEIITCMPVTMMREFIDIYDGATFLDIVRQAKTDLDKQEKEAI